MVARNTLLEATPYPGEHALKKIGSNLRIARLRRKLTIQDVAEKIGAGPRAIRAAENGNPSTLIAVYAALLWAYGLLSPFEDLANPADDQEGLALSGLGIGVRARRSKGLDNDF
ncbi:MAG TPA: XRE family transcriptional regulator [Candidatus Angelobacter sp.]|jgi:transcriptional regulator with XRE-family HTH domain|nr:XRE family transcriptional regulator [Candidatus Angelobacter sp.]